MPNRGVVIKPLRAGEPFGQPLRDRAYRTPRFPDGVKRNELRWQPPEIRRETMLIWFLRNYEPPRGPYFGFGEAGAPARQPLTFDGTVTFDGSARYDGLKPSSQDVQIAGFDQAPFYDGGTPDVFLQAEFAEWIDADILGEVAEALPGQWVLKPEIRLPAADASAEELRAALGNFLVDFDRSVGELPTPEVERWHNDPPERLPNELPVLAPQERERLLRATADIRLAVDSQDYSRAGAFWEAVAPALAKVAAYVLRQADAFVGIVNKTVAAGIGVAILAGLAWAVGLLEKAEAISALLKALHLS